jgi:hypothetical protein
VTTLTDEDGVTVRVAVWLVTLPTALLTTTSNVELLSAVVVVGVGEPDAVAPEMFAPFFCHW